MTRARLRSAPADAPCPREQPVAEADNVHAHLQQPVAHGDGLRGIAHHDGADRGRRLEQRTRRRRCRPGCRRRCREASSLAAAWPPVIARTVEKFLACGDLKEGFARVRCPSCAYEFFVASVTPGRRSARFWLSRSRGRTSVAGRIARSWGDSTGCSIRSWSMTRRPRPSSGTRPCRARRRVGEGFIPSRSMHVALLTSVEQAGGGQPRPYVPVSRPSSILRSH